MAIVARTLDRIKQDLEPFIPESSIQAACEEAGYHWRQRVLGPVQTVHLFIQQVLCFNTAMTHLRHLADVVVSASAYCKARQRLPLAVLQTLLVQSSRAMRSPDADPSGRWCGLRTYLVDGSSSICPDTDDSQKAFGQPSGCKEGCGFPVPKVLGLFDAFTGLIVEMLCFPLRTHEQSKVSALHPLLGKDDLLVGDRGFCSFAHFAMLFSRGIHGLFRVHQKQIIDFRPHRKHRTKYEKKRKGAERKKMPRSKFIKRLGWHDQIVEWYKPQAKPKWMEKEQFDALPASLLIRELRYTLARKGQRTRVVTIATTLLDPSLYPREKIEALYGVRWRVETHFAQLKTTLGMRKVKGHSADVVKKELAAYALVYNLVHAVMMKAAERQEVTPDRISFLDTVRWLLSAEPGEALPDLIINPHRPDRHEPRVTKDREDTYTKMTRPRAELTKWLKTQGKAA